MARFEYEGDVRLGMQEGGFAEWSIDLLDLAKQEGDLFGGIHNIVDLLSNQDLARTLGDVLSAEFETLSDDRSGNQYLGRVRIVVEQLEPTTTLPSHVKSLREGLSPRRTLHEPAKERIIPPGEST